MTLTKAFTHKMNQIFRLEKKTTNSHLIIFSRGNWPNSYIVFIFGLDLYVPFLQTEKSDGSVGNVLMLMLSSFLAAYR